MHTMKRMGKSRISNTAGLALLGPVLFTTWSSHTPLRAAEAAHPAAADTTKLTAGVTLPKYNGVRVGDIAPLFTLPDNGDANKLWSSHAQLGQRSILVMLVGDNPAPEVGVRVAAMNSLDKVATGLVNTNVVPVLVFTGNTAIKVERTNNSQLVILQDARGDLQKAMGVNPLGLTLVAIDRAGFVRRIDTVRDPALAGPLMQQISDPTPRLQVGKPAPDFAIPDMYGRIRRLSELRGQKNLVMSFFPKCFTGG